MTTRGALVLLHGATANHRMWDPVRRLLEPDFTVVAPDLPGHGTRADTPFTLAATVEVVQDAVRALAPLPVVVVGDSLGGYAAMAAGPHLATPPLRGLVLSGCSSNIRGTRLPPYLLQMAIFSLAGALFGRERLEKRMAAELAKRLDPALVEAILEGGIRTAALGEAVWELNATDFRAIIASLGVPLLFLNGSRDLGHVRFEASFVKAARFATAERFAGAEHGISLLRPVEFAAAVERFANRVLADAA